MEKNCHKFGAPGITTVIGDFLEADLTNYPAPDAVFIGGHGGRLKEIIAKVKEVMLPGACIVFNSVSAESRQLFEESVASARMRIIHSTRSTIDEFNPISILKAE